MSHRRAIADMVERSIRTREENMDLRARIRELEERLQHRDMLWENAIRQTGYDIPPHSQKEFIDACRKRVHQENS